ncbi:MAG: pyruvate dehydrogenase (acetyl-transferring) E1 component subunit alpha [Planctomycetes bacterium]|nr:pyruvate dehydrogenase (acetyl-transferring) E1 component subunit alpha [Planctomycetota bacterium]
MTKSRGKSATPRRAPQSRPASPASPASLAGPAADEPFSVLESDGKASKDKDPNLPAEQLRRLYEVMLMTRVLDERALALQRQGRIGVYLQALGQEASHVGAAAALRDADWLFPAYRQPGIPVLRGVPLDDIVNEWYGNDGDICKGRQMPVHYSFRQANFVSISSPIGTQISQAVGAGMAARIRGDDTVFMTFFGDGGTSSNDFHCGMNFAGVYSAPVVFVCENNQWAISVPLSQQTASASIAVKASAYGMPGVRVDGNDVLAVYRVCKEAVERARKGEGPTLVETVTYRMASHSSSDDAARYRDAKVYEEWKQRDPIQRFQRYLQKKKLWTEAWDQEIQERAKQAINEAVKQAEARPRPSLDSLFEDVFMNLTPQLVEQRAELLSLKGPESEELGHFPL